MEKSPTGKVPMIVEDDSILYESQVINDYLVERYSWDNAYASETRLKYQQKVGMKQWDNVILGPVYQSLSNSEQLREHWSDVEPELNFLEDVVRDSGRETDSLFAYHFAPFWARFRWLSEYTSFPDRVETFDLLCDWFDDILREEPISETLPDPDWTREQYEKHYVN